MFVLNLLELFDVILMCLKTNANLLNPPTGPIVGHVSARLWGNVAARSWGMCQPECWACLSPIVGQYFSPMVGHVSARVLGMSQPDSGASPSPTRGLAARPDARPYGQLYCFLCFSFASQQ